ncbi:PilX N-terminal domain-containing pilus assembly protein [Uliginosibacterium sp. sgz301328]|uniref:pilus assembly PilX family protein n=1 Tax=Uliginosibacterium sp. sgz301328 TaxID=3243764 RepID=UPI00359E7D5C
MRVIVSRRQSQRGVALIMALVLLIMVALLAAVGFGTASVESRGAAGWGDRQRAFFLAESAAKEAESVVAALTTSADLATAVRAKGTGFYVRADGGVPAYNPWPTSSSVKASKLVTGTTDAYYMVVFEGFAPALGSQLVGNNGAVNLSMSGRPRFTIYASAGGLRGETNVVLSMSREY